MLVVAKLAMAFNHPFGKLDPGTLGKKQGWVVRRFVMYKVINLENYKEVVDWMFTAGAEELIQNGEAGLELPDGTVVYSHHTGGKLYITTNPVFDKNIEVKQADLSYIVDVMWKYIPSLKSEVVVDIYKNALLENSINEEQLKKILLLLMDYIAEKMFAEINKAD